MSVNGESARSGRRLVWLDSHSPEHRQGRRGGGVSTIDEGTFEDDRPTIISVGMKSQIEDRRTAKTPPSLRNEKRQGFLVELRQENTETLTPKYKMWSLVGHRGRAASGR